MGDLWSRKVSLLPGVLAAYVVGRQVAWGFRVHGSEVLIQAFWCKGLMVLSFVAEGCAGSAVVELYHAASIKVCPGCYHSQMCRGGMFEC